MAQKIKGWGVYPAGGTNGLTFNDSIQRLLFGMGVTYVRERVAPELYVSGTTVANMIINTDTLNAYIAKLDSAKVHGVDSGYIMSVWSPPKSMKTDTTTVNGGSLNPAKTGAFVAYLTKVMLLLKASTVGAPRALSIANEPDYTNSSYPTTLYDSLQWDSTIKDVRGSFVFNGLSSIRLLGPESGHYNTAAQYLGGALFPKLGPSGNGSLDSAVRAFAVHSYGQCGIDTYRDGVNAQQQYRDAWQTEFSILDKTATAGKQLDYTLTTFSSLGADLAIVPNNYWTWWNGYSQNAGTYPDGGTLISGTNTTPIISKRFYALRKLWHLVRPGWSVKRMTSSSDPQLHIDLTGQSPCATGGHGYVDLTAFVNSANDTIVVMLVNHTTTDKTVKIGGFPTNFNFQHSFRTDTTSDMVAQTGTNVFMGYSTVSLPARSLVLAIMNP